MQRASEPPSVQRAATILRLAGNTGFWLQLILGVLAAALLLLSVAGLAGDTKTTSGATLSIFCATGAVISLAISIFLYFRYKRIAQLIENAPPGDRPDKKTTIRMIKLGLTTNLVGMFLAIIGAESFVGILWRKSSNVPQGANITYDPSQIVVPSEVLLVLANTHTILCHFIGIMIGLWLLDRLNHLGNQN